MTKKLRAFVHIDDQSMIPAHQKLLSKLRRNKEKSISLKCYNNSVDFQKKRAIQQLYNYTYRVRKFLPGGKQKKMKWKTEIRKKEFVSQK